jgi:hypothetical protein
LGRSTAVFLASVKDSGETVHCSWGGSFVSHQWIALFRDYPAGEFELRGEKRRTPFVCSILVAYVAFP